MARLFLLAIAVVAMTASAAAWPHAGTVQNKFMVTYSIIPDPFHMKSFFTMPRTMSEAENDMFVFTDLRPQDNTSVYCRDFRVCVIFDQKESVAGIRLSVRKSEIDASGFDLKEVPEWELNMSPMELDYVYSATVFFQSKEDLLAGGRTLSEDDLTAPNGIYILQTDSEGRERNRLHVPTAQSEAETAGFTEQACFFGMGKHYFQELRKDGRCEDHRPYFMLYGPQTKKLNGFGFVQFGKVTTGDRPWFESPPATVAKMIAPNSPACLEPWVSNRGLFTIHVYFVSDPYYTTC